MSTPLPLSLDQVRWFRANRQHLAGPGAPDSTTAARDILGAQAQVIEPSLHAISMRTASRPTAHQLGRDLLEGPRTLVRTWGPRETVHLYDPADWAQVIAGRQLWSRMGRQGQMPDDSQMDAAADRIREHGGIITRKELAPFVPADLVDMLAPIATKARIDPLTFAAGRLLFGLAKRGDVCSGPKRGSEQTYELRVHVYPQLDWHDHDPVAASQAHIARYLTAFGPASEHDIAHYLGAKITLVRKWLEPMKKGLVRVDAEGRDLWAHAHDAQQLRAPIGEWPVRMLAKFDTLLMGHRDKVWTVPDESERPAVWGKAAQVYATVLHRGQVVATWKHKATKTRLNITVSPLSGWRQSMFGDVEVESVALAAHLGMAGSDVNVTVE